VPAVVAQQREIHLRAEVLASVARLQQFAEDWPEVLGERVVEMHAGDGLHDPSVAVAEPVAVHGLHSPDVRLAVLRDRDAFVPLDGARHAGRPEQFLIHALVHEAVQVAEVLEEFPALGKGWRDQLDQRFGVVGRDVLVGERRPQRLRVRGLDDQAPGRDPQRLLLDPLQAALQGTTPPAVHQGGEALVEDAVEGHRIREPRKNGLTGYQSRPFTPGSGAVSADFTAVVGAIAVGVPGRTRHGCRATLLATQNRSQTPPLMPREPAFSYMKQLLGFIVWCRQARHIVAAGPLY
jgi:hypothetical protein